MARIPIVREGDPATPPEAREFPKRVEGGFGEVFNSMRLFANQPQMANAFVDFRQSIRHHGNLNPLLSELAWTTASLVNACHY
jgi:alkylhydroperoxidase family enzyme